MKYNETNLQKQKDLLKQFGKEKSRGSSDGRERPKRSKSVKEKAKVEKEPETKPEVRRTSVDLNVTNNQINQEPKRKKARVESVEEKEEIEIVHEMFDTSLNIPHELGVMLADDWDLINHQKQLYDLPAKVTVEDILNKYLESRNNLSIVTQQSSIQLKEMVLGLSEYFSVML
uniref:MRG domain-containing protein n=2 Tax=Ciona intestinalis TaxID=7719 RepID=F6WEI4_CIOIN